MLRLLPRAVGVESETTHLFSASARHLTGSQNLVIVCMAPNEGTVGGSSEHGGISCFKAVYCGNEKKGTVNFSQGAGKTKKVLSKSKKAGSKDAGNGLQAVGRCRCVGTGLAPPSVPPLRLRTCRRLRGRSRTFLLASTCRHRGCQAQRARGASGISEGAPTSLLLRGDSSNARRVSR